MIKMEIEKKDYFKCNACLSSNHVKRIIIGPNEGHTSSIRLCDKCIERLKVLREVLEDD